MRLLLGAVTLFFALFVQASESNILEFDVLDADSYGEFTCVIVAQGSFSYGSVKCWGDNTENGGGLGLGFDDRRGDDGNEMGNYLAVINLGEGVYAKKIAVGHAHACAILHTDRVKCWGWNEYGQLGQGDDTDRGNKFSDMGGNLPEVELMAGFTKAIDISAGRNHTCAIIDDGGDHILKCWGRNSNGQLGVGNPFDVGDLPGEMGANLLSVDLGTDRYPVKVVAGWQHTCALLDNSDVKCWGGNDFGQLGQEHTNDLGDGANEMGNNLAAIDFGTNVIATDLSAHGRHTCVILEDDQFQWGVKCWGRNHKGQLGLGHTNDQGDGANEMGTNLDYVDLAGEDAYEIAVGKEHSCVVTSSEEIKCWGENGAGTLGIGNQNDIGDGPNEMGLNLVPVDLDVSISPDRIFSGSYHMCTRDMYDNSLLSCWGWNHRGQLGLGDTDHRGDTPNEVNVLSRIDIGSKYAIVKQISYACMILQDYNLKNYLKCWGNFHALGHAEYMGDEPNEIGHYLPAINLGEGRTPKYVSSSSVGGCVILDNDSVKCWGSNNVGQVGAGHNNRVGDELSEVGDSWQTVDLGVGKSAKSVSVGNASVCALLNDDSIKCWGENSSGQLGLGDKNPRGDDPNEMGNNLPAIDLGTGRTAKSIHVGASHACAVLDNDTVKCWGENSSGQLGLGDNNPRGDGANEMGNNLPAVDLGAGRTVAALATGYLHNCAILDNDDLKCWGSNLRGQLGLGHTDTLGDQANEMGNNLAAVDLANRVPVKLSTAYSSCVITVQQQTLCWGNNTTGQLGLGDKLNRGDDPNEMGNNLPVISIGQTFALEVFTRAANTYAIDGVDAYAWGDGGLLFKGEGTTQDIGDQPNEMGANLDPFDLEFGIQN